MRDIKRIILHCTATREGKDYSVDTIRKWHTDKGWSDIGYHYIVYRDGSIHPGRPVERMGAHVRGYNASSIGIAYIGGVASEQVDGKWVPKDTRTPQQKEALDCFIRGLLEKYPGSTLHGHNEYSAKACPSFNVQIEYDYIINPNEPIKIFTDDHICKRELHRFHE